MCSNIVFLVYNKTILICLVDVVLCVYVHKETIYELFMNHLLLKIWLYIARSFVIGTVPHIMHYSMVTYANR